MEREVYIYHEIDTEEGWHEVMTPDQFVEDTEGCNAGDTVNIHVNSPGGIVFAAVAMCARIQQLQAKGITVDAYIDGLAASAASFLVMACDHIYCYGSSMLMVHKPMCSAFGNADDLVQQAEILEKIENECNMPLYEKKAKAEIEDIKKMINAETWLGADEMCKVFDIEKLEGNVIVDAISLDKFSNFKNVPDSVKAMAVEQKTEQESTPESDEPEGWYYELLQKAIQSI